MAEQRYSSKEALNRIYREFIGERVTSDVPGNVTGEILSEDGTLSKIAELIANSLPNKNFYLPTPTRIGVGDNYVLISRSGEISLHGTAKTKNAIWLSADGIKAPGAKPATYVTHGLGGAWSFSDEAVEANQQTISGVMRVANRMDKPVAPSFCIGWSADGTSPGVCEWQLEYLWTALNESTIGAAQETLTVTSIASATANGLITAEITGVDIPSTSDICLHFRLTRLSAGTNDTIADTTELIGVLLDFTSDKLGAAT